MRVRTASLRSTFLAATIAAGLVLAGLTVGGPAANASTTPCGSSTGYCYFLDLYGDYLVESTNVAGTQVVVTENDSNMTAFSWVNEAAWSGHDVYEMYFHPNGTCVTWEGKSDNVFLLEKCDPGLASQEFWYSGATSLVNVGATGVYGKSYCLTDFELGVPNEETVTAVASCGSNDKAQEWEEINDN
jgi:hypothetical protein